MGFRDANEEFYRVVGEMEADLDLLYEYRNKYTHASNDMNVLLQILQLPGILGKGTPSITRHYGMPFDPKGDYLDFKNMESALRQFYKKQERMDKTLSYINGYEREE